MYHFDSDGGIPFRLKVKINCQEHHTMFGIHDVKHAIQSAWNKDEVLVWIHELAELLETKMRACTKDEKEETCLIF